MPTMGRGRGLPGAARRASAAAPARRLRAGVPCWPRCSTLAARQPARPAQPDHRRAGLPGRRHRGRAGRRARSRRCSTAIAASLLLNYYFTPPLHTFTIAEANNALALVVFVVVAAGGQLRRRRRGPADQAGGPGRAPSPSCWSPRRAACCAASRPLAARARTGRESVRHGIGDPAGTRPADRGAARGPTGRLDRGRRSGGPELSPAGRCRRGDAGHRQPLSRAARPAAARHRPQGARRVRRLCRRRAGAAAPGRRGRGGPAHRRGRPDADRAARRGQPRPADAARRRPRRPSPACASDDVQWAEEDQRRAARHRR